MTAETTGWPNILVVDDMPQNLQVVGEHLAGKLNCNLYFATNGAEALESVRVIHPDLILLDVMMPDMDGYELCRRFKAQAETAEIPILFLTARVDKNDVIKGLECGAADYITKPFNAAELISRVKTHLKIRESAVVIARQNEELRQLLRILCHDLANPVGCFSSLIALLDTPEDLPEIREHMQSMADSAMALIDVVRQLRAMDEGKIVPAMKSCKLADLCHEAVRTVEHRMGQKEVTVRCEVPEELAVYVEPTLFVHSVLCNMLTNAAKFSPRGAEVTVKAKLSPDSDRVILGIADSGIGIPPAILEVLFDPARQTSRPGTEGEAGTGFGMLLAKKFIEQCGGTLAVTSQTEADSPRQHGTTVTLRLPAHIYSASERNNTLLRS